MKEVILNLIQKYGWFIVGGLIGAIIQRVRNSMSLKRFIGTLIVSAFVGLSVGIVLRNYLNASEEVIFVACSVSGVFSQDILNEIQELISYISVYVKKILKINSDE